MIRKISPANGYCLFFPSRKPGHRFVSGQSVWVRFTEEWKHVKLGLFEVQLPGAQPLLITTSEQLECTVKASFGIVIGGPKDGREERLEKATLSCPASRSLQNQDRVELVPFFRDWATNYCRTAIINTIKECQYVRLIEDADYRSKSERSIEEFARKTLAEIGMMLVQCTVIVEPMEPKNIFATPEIIARWEAYKRTVNEAEISKKKADNAHTEAQKQADIEHGDTIQRLDEQHRRTEADVKQDTEIRLRELALELKKKEALLAVEEQQELSNKDSRIGAIQAEMDRRAQEVQLQRLRREAELKQEKERNDKELADLKLKHEGEQLDQQQDLLRKQKLEAESKLELISLEQKRNAVDVELERSKGQVKADNLEREILAKGAHETKMRQMLLDALPKIVEQASRPIEKIGEIKAIHISGGQGPDGSGSSNLGSLFASASSLPIVRELLKFFSEVEGSDRSEPGKGIR